MAPQGARLQDWLSAAERDDWQAWVRAKLGANEAPWRTLRQFDKEVAELLATADSRQREVLEALAVHGGELRKAYGL